MKHNFLMLLRAGTTLVVLLLLFAGCGADRNDGEDPVPELEFIIWKVAGGGYVKKDGVEISTLNALEITFLKNGTYQSTGGATTDKQMKIFLPVGTWSWQGSNAAFLRDGIATQVEELTSTSLTLTFVMNADVAGDINERPASIVGNYELKLIKK